MFSCDTVDRLANAFKQEVKKNIHFSKLAEAENNIVEACKKIKKSFNENLSFQDNLKRLANLMIEEVRREFLI